MNAEIKPYYVKYIEWLNHTKRIYNKLKIETGDIFYNIKTKGETVGRIARLEKIADAMNLLSNVLLKSYLNLSHYKSKLKLSALAEYENFDNIYHKARLLMKTIEKYLNTKDAKVLSTYSLDTHVIA